MNLHANQLLAFAPNLALGPELPLFGLQIAKLLIAEGEVARDSGWSFKGWRFGLNHWAEEGFQWPLP